MASVEKVSVALSPELLEMVRAAVASGDYASTSEVVREALRDWRTRQEIRHAELERLRHGWKLGLDSGEPELLDATSIKRKARDRLAEMTKSRAAG